METVNLIKLKVEDNKHHVTSKKNLSFFYFLLLPFSFFLPVNALHPRNSQRLDPLTVEQRQRTSQARNVLIAPFA